MGQNVVPYAYRRPICEYTHTHMGRPIRVWANIRMHMGQNKHTSIIGQRNETKVW